MSVIDLTPIQKQDAAATQNPQTDTNIGEVVTPAVNEGKLETPKINEGEMLADQNKEQVTKTIRLDGPLSSIYAQALNVMYAKESAADGSMGSSLSQQTADDEGVDPDLYVYVTDDESMDLEGVGKHFDALRVALDRFKEKPTIVVLENHKPMRMAVAALENFAHEQAKKVYYRRDIALEAILGILQTKA